MKKNYIKGLFFAAAFTGTALLLSSTGAQAYTHDRVTLKDASGGSVVVNTTSGVGPAYSAKETCGACHDYKAIERHSYHAQLGANQYMGWNAWAYGNWNSVATKGKPWVQSPGHAGKW